LVKDAKQMSEELINDILHEIGLEKLNSPEEQAQ